jgi:nucleotide-binding universal stress UspA family protein
MEWKKILCPTDFSDTSRAALRVAITLAGKLEAELMLFHVYHAPGVTLPDGLVIGGPEQMLEISREVDQAMQRWLAEAESLGATRVATSTAIGETHSEIERVAAEGDYDVVVMGTHGRTGLSHALLGSTAEKVMQRCACPVLTIRLPR